jgi:hypothetical protein
MRVFRAGLEKAIPLLRASSAVMPHPLKLATPALLKAITDDFL